MDYDKSLKLAMKQWLIEKGMDVDEVLYYNQTTYESSYCENCRSVDYILVLVEIDYNSSSGSRRFEYFGNFASLIRELSDVEVEID